MNIAYNDAKNLIQEADVLLFRAGTLRKNPIGWFIGAYTKSIYSHVGLAHWENGELYCVEFREFIGSRQYPMDQYVLQRSNSIDVFRPVKSVLVPKLLNNQIGYEGFLFSKQVAENVVNTALQFVGQSYSYWTIWQMFKTYVPFIRLRTKIVKNGEPNPKRFVCSTLITYAYRINYIDPVPFLYDDMTSPGDLARSSLFSYLFSF